MPALEYRLEIPLDPDRSLKLSRLQELLESKTGKKFSRRRIATEILGMYLDRPDILEEILLKTSCNSQEG